MLRSIYKKITSTLTTADSNKIKTGAQSDDTPTPHTMASKRQLGLIGYGELVIPARVCSSFAPARSLGDAVRTSHIRGYLKLQR